MNGFLPFTTFAFSYLEHFPALKKNVCLEYLVVSENTDCALLFDDFWL